MADEHIGKSVAIKTEEGIFNGIIHAIDVKNHKIILHKVSLSDGKRLRGLQIFFRDEIQDLNLIDENTPKTEEEQERSSTDDDRETNNEEISEEDAEIEKQNENLLEDQEAKDPSDEGNRLINRAPIPPNKCLAGDESFLRNVNKGKVLDPPEVKLIDEFGDDFNNAIECINTQRVVGLAAEGENIGRFGELYLLIVGCRQTTYIFDIYKLGESSFSEGLTSVLENCFLLKVIHDCRALSDCLHHKYNTTMKNIFDTQVADIIIYKQKRGKLPRDVNGLIPCLYEYLNLEPVQCQFQNILQRFYKSSGDLIQRPILPELLNAVAEKVLYLRELRTIQTEQMLAEFLFGVDLYLADFRDLSEDSFKLRKPNKKVPNGFNSLGNVAERRWKRYEQRDKNIDAYEKDGKDMSIYVPPRFRNQKNDPVNNDKKHTKDTLIRTPPRFQKGKNDRVNDDEKFTKDIRTRTPPRFRKGKNDDDSPSGWTEGNDFASMYSKRHGKIVQCNDMNDSGGKWNTLNGKSHMTSGEVPWQKIRKEQGNENGMNTRFSSADSSPEAKQSKEKERSLKDEDIYWNENDFADQEVAAETHSVIKHEVQLKDHLNHSRSPKDQSIPLLFGNEYKALTQRQTDNTEAYIEQDNYNNAFPQLTHEQQKISTEQIHNDKNNYVFTEKLESTRRDLFGGNNVHNASPVLARGRAKMRQTYSKNARTINEFSKNKLSEFPKRLVNKDSFAFPSDTDLLESSPIIESHASSVAGPKVKLQKIKTKD